MATFLSPNVRITEVDISEFVSNVPVSVGLMVVRSKRGNIEPEFISSTRDFRRKYCYDRVKVDRDLIELQSAMDFLSTGYSGLWVCRALSSGSRGACIVVNKVQSENVVTIIAGGLSLKSDKSGYVFPQWGTLPPTPLFILYAKGPGDVGNRFRVSIPSVDFSRKVFRLRLEEVLPDGSVELLLDREVSTVPDMKDGYGNSMYIADVLEKHPDIGVRVNPEMVGELPIAFSNPVNFAGGRFFEPSVGDVVEALSIWEFKNRERWDVDILVQGGIGGDVYRSELVELAEERGDCIALLDVDEDVYKVSDIVSWRKMAFTVSSSYGAVFSPWLKVYDFENDREKFVPPSGVVGGLMVRCDREFDPWWVPAGLTRGVVNVLGLKYYYSSADRDELDRVQVNCFVRKPGVIALWNNRTLQTFESAFSFIETRRLFNYIKKNVCRTIDKFLFEPLTDGTRLRLVAMLDEFLRTIKQRLGIYDYKVVCSPLGTGNNPWEQVDQGLLTVEIYVKPTRAIRYIWLKVIAAKSGYRFEEGIE